jgi:hypothetical protein
MAGSSILVRVENELSRQHGLVTRSQLLQAGSSPSQIHRLLRTRAIQPVRAGVYVLTGTPRTRQQALLGAVLAGGDGAVASHSSAAWMWKFPIGIDTGFEITVPRPRHPEVDGVRVHTTTILEPGDVATRGGVPCTSFERTLCDSTGEHSFAQLSRVIDDGLRRGVTSIDRVHACLLRIDSGPLRRLTIVQGLLRDRGVGYNPGGSGAELRVLRALTAAGIPPPKQQHRVTVNGRTYFLDYAYEEARRFIEYYELRSHSTASAVAYDSDRITDLATIGWTPMIFTDANSDRDIVERTAQALGISLDAIDARRSA